MQRCPLCMLQHWVISYIIVSRLCYIFTILDHDIPVVSILGPHDNMLKIDGCEDYRSIPNRSHTVYLIMWMLLKISLVDLDTCTCYCATDEDCGKQS